MHIQEVKSSSRKILSNQKKYYEGKHAISKF